MDELKSNTDDVLNESFESRIDLSHIKEGIDKLRSEIGKIIVGQTELIDLMITAILADGHILIEGVPGIAKTLSAKLMAKTLNIDFQRIQFTPDLMPSDLLGTSVFNPKITDFEFKAGPIFSNLILIDEINRSPAKTQAALFEVMEEKQITIDGKTYEMSTPFIVLATQNPVDQEGTYALPEAQIDRFLFRIDVTYPELEDEIQMLENIHSSISYTDISNVNAVINAEEISTFRKIVHQVYVKKELIEYIVKLVAETRNNPALFIGASPRASISILKSAKAWAAINGRDFVEPEDIQYVAYPVLRHRLILTAEKEMEGIDSDVVIKEILSKIEVPR